jgi:GNAT superfamily N-acetyltransferase
MKTVVHPLTAGLWPAFEDLFGARGACNGCWCMYWRIGPAYRKRPRELNRKDFFKIVEGGPPPGLLAFQGDLAVGWCQLTPRESLPVIDRNWRLRRVDDLPVWCISCFYVRIGHRRQGVTSALIKGALKYAKAHGAMALEAYPLDADLTPSSSSTGYSTTFERTGFQIIARHFPPRPIMRYDFKAEARLSSGATEENVHA